MTVVSKPVSVGKLRAFLLFGEVPLFLRQLFSQKNLVHALAGALGGISSLSIFFPLDTAKTRLQIDDERKAKTTWKVIYEIVHEEGLSSLYRGLLPVLSSLYCSNFVYFYTFNGLKAAYVTKRSPETVVVDLLCGFLAGVINVLITTPLWVANTRMKLQGVNLKSEELSRKVQYKYTGLIDAVHQIYRTEGLRGLWSGTRASLVLTSNPAIQFTVYETIKRYVRGAGKDLPSWKYFMIGAIAKTMATILTYPCQVAQCKQRTGYWKDESKKPNFVVIMAQILRFHVHSKSLGMADLNFIFKTKQSYI
ncbi:peroxisomal membrane protein PMP34-like isoform X2 [Xenia sp. Carnegie-2017]|uniref:peroxisomal membrane protein PMP34-like isoform X2 n=1 Tax=Xenia sp. Carnegie-2017 TaxID=2897299 RepID=UPI001F042BD7|nr:peroxisomal membrane protein PMP34-like isoform X2 [Xenia sp. Carnegie-2017]